MIIEIYLLIQCLIFVLMWFGWKDKHPMYWALGFVFSAILIFSSYNIEYVVMVLSDNVLSGNIISMSFPILSYINIMLFVLCLTVFFLDIFEHDNGLER